MPGAFLIAGEQSRGHAAPRLRRDYDAAELDVAAGDTVAAGEAVEGWTWCEAAARAGWVPSGKLGPA